jgi:C_GCAxxG_C_C family probable redox protein
MIRTDRAIALFQEGFSCSQSVFAAYSDMFGLDRETSLRLSQPLGGGMAHLGEACGAVTGAFLLIGLKLGRTRADDLAARERTYEAQRLFAERFKGLHGSIQCRGLLGVDIGTEEGRRLARERNLYRTLCAKYVENAAAIVGEIL